MNVGSGGSNSGRSVGPSNTSMSRPSVANNSIKYSSGKNSPRHLSPHVRRMTAGYPPASPPMQQQQSSSGALPHSITSSTVGNIPSTARGQMRMERMLRWQQKRSLSIPARLVTANAPCKNPSNNAIEVVAETDGEGQQNLWRLRVRYLGSSKESLTERSETSSEWEQTNPFNLILQNHPPRRGSFLYLRDENEQLECSTSRRSSKASSMLDMNATEPYIPIVTPFAQVLAVLKEVRGNFLHLTQQHQHSIRSRQSTVTNSPAPSGENNNATDMKSPCVIRGADHNETSAKDGERSPIIAQQKHQQQLASDTLTELDWCLNQLQTLHTERSVSDMAYSKFKRLLNKELQQFKRGDKSDLQISDFIRGYLESDVERISNMDNDPNSVFTAFRPKIASQISEVSVANSTGGLSDNSDAGTSSVATPPPPRFLRIMTLKQRDATSSTTASSPSHSPTPSATMNLPSSSTEISLFNFELQPLDVSEDVRTMIVNNLNSWNLDVFKLDELDNKQSLSVMTLYIFHKRGFFRTFNIFPATLLNFVGRIEANYSSEVPYHNALHAADVTHSVHFLLSATALEGVFTELEKLAVLLAAIIHDVGHPGLTNHHLVSTGHELAILYNDCSVLENHHLSLAFQLMKEENCDILLQFTVKQRQLVRKMMIDLVLSTDMSKHMSLLAALKTLVETRKITSGVLNLEDYCDRIQILQSMMHCADLGNPTKHLSIYRNWIDRIMEEFFRQGDKERSLSMDISPMCDRFNISIPKSQMSFIDFIVHPLWETWADLVHPSALSILDTLEENREWLHAQISSSVGPSDNPSPTTGVSVPSTSSRSSLQLPSTPPTGFKPFSFTWNHDSHR